MNDYRVDFKAVDETRFEIANIKLQIKNLLNSDHVKSSEYINRELNSALQSLDNGFASCMDDWWNLIDNESEIK